MATNTVAARRTLRFLLSYAVEKALPGAVLSGGQVAGDFYVYKLSSKDGDFDISAASKSQLQTYSYPCNQGRKKKKLEWFYPTIPTYAHT